MPKRTPDEPLPPGGMVRKTAFLAPEEASALEALAVVTGRSESDLMREGWEGEKHRVLDGLDPDQRSLFNALLKRKLAGKS